MLLKYSPCLAGLFSPLSSQKFAVQTFFTNDSLILKTIALNLCFSFISVWEGIRVFVGSCIILCGVFFLFLAALGIVLTQPRPLHSLYFWLKKLEVCINMSDQEVERFPWAYQHTLNSLLLSADFFVVILVRVLVFCTAFCWGVQSLYKVFSLKM